MKEVVKPIVSVYLDNNLGTNPDMVDADNFKQSVIGRFEAGADLQEGVSGRTKIDTKYEGTHEAISERPKSGEAAPKLVDRGLFPTRAL
jgi:hypothetical protein